MAAALSNVASTDPMLPCRMPGPPAVYCAPQLLLLYGWLCFAGCIGVYSVKKVMLSNKDGA
jgi:hypothetical protein